VTGKSRVCCTPCLIVTLSLTTRSPVTVTSPPWRHRLPHPDTELYAHAHIMATVSDPSRNSTIFSNRIAKFSNHITNWIAVFQNRDLNPSHNLDLPITVHFSYIPPILFHHQLYHIQYTLIYINWIFGSKSKYRYFFRSIDSNSNINCTFKVIGNGTIWHITLYLLLEFNNNCFQCPQRVQMFLAAEMDY